MQIHVDLSKKEERYRELEMDEGRERKGGEEGWRKEGRKRGMKKGRKQKDI